MKHYRDDTDAPYRIEHGKNELPTRRGFFAHLFDPLPEDVETPELQPEFIRAEARRAAKKAARRERRRRFDELPDDFDEIEAFDDGETELVEPPRDEKRGKKKKKKRRPQPVEAFEDDFDEADTLEDILFDGYFADEPTEEPIDEPEFTDEPTDEPEFTDEPIDEPGFTDEPINDPEFTDEPTIRIEPALDDAAAGEAADEPAEAPVEADSSDETIRLFDDVEDAAGAAHTRFFRTGSTAATRIQLNDTEETVRIREAERKARLRAIAEKKEAEAERRNRREKRRSAFKKLFSNVAFIVFFLVAVAVAGYYCFLLNDIVILGNETYSEEYIEGLSGLKRGTHMLLCKFSAVEEGISEDPYIQVEQVSYIFPNRIRIIVSERREVAGITGLNYNVIIDKNGYVLSMSGGTDISGLLQVTGVRMTGFELGQRLGQGDDFTTASLIAIIDALDRHELTASIRSIDLTTPLAITLRASNGLTVHLGQPTDLDAKMASLAKLLPQFLKQNITTGVLYLSAKGGTVYSPSGADQLALARKEAEAAAAAQAQMLAEINDFVDDDGDGVDDVTGEDIILTTPDPELTPTPAPTPTPKLPGGSADDFSG